MATGGGMAEEEDLSVKTMRKRYEGLLLVRSKALKGKGAWYWAHLEPTLVTNPETGAPKAVKLKCALCSTMFSASNPSRTASEHLKRGTCPNFSTALASARPPPALPLPPPPPPSATAAAATQKARKRSSSSSSAPAPAAGAAAGDDSRQQATLQLSGGKEDLGALALLEDNVKRIKSPALGQGLSREQSEAAVALLAEWVYESYGLLPLGCVEHPKFRAFLAQVGLPPLSRGAIAGARLDARYEEVRRQSEDRLRDALFFQLSVDGWKRKPVGEQEQELVLITLNLPNGSSLFSRALPASLSSKAVEAAVEEAMAAACGGSPERCVGVVADVHKAAAKALHDMEARRPWMVNVACQARAFASMLNTIGKRSPLFRYVSTGCLKLAAFFRANAPARALLQRCQREAYGRVLRPLVGEPGNGGGLAAASLAAEVSETAAALHAAAADGSFKMMYGDDPEGRDVTELVGSQGFWSDCEAVVSLVAVVQGMIHDMEREPPLVSQCILLWNELRSRVAGWSARYGARDKGAVETIVAERFGRNYHPAWAAALVLDPLYLVRDAAGCRYLPYKLLSSEQEKDVDRLITRLVSREEAHIVLMELMKWRSEGLDPLYGQAVQIRDASGTKCMSAASRRLVWETCLREFKLLGKVAARLIFLHATSCRLSSSSWTPSLAGGGERAAKMLYIAAHARLERGGGGDGDGWGDGAEEAAGSSGRKEDEEAYL